MSSQTTSEATPSAISSPASADGATRSDWPDGAMTDLFGRVVAPVNPIAPRGRTQGRLTHGTFGRRGFASSASARLASSLASRLIVRLGTAGSTLFQQTWKRKITPSGRVFWAHHSVQAPHIRARIFYVAHRGSAGLAVGNESSPVRRTRQTPAWREFERVHAASAWSAWQAESDVPVFADGVSDLVGAVTAYGNAIVPQVAAEFIGAYLDAERC